MKLPTIKQPSGIKKEYQDKFKGLNHNKGAGDGELWDMRNLTSEYFPLLATRPERRLYRKLKEPHGMFEWEGLAWVDGDGFFFNGERKGTVSRSAKSFAALGAYIVIMPDKAWYNVDTGEFGQLESSWSGRLTFTNGLSYGEEAKANTLQASGVAWSNYFNPGDAVTIEGCTKHAENNKTPIIREIDGDKLYFYEYTFTLDGEDAVAPYTEPGQISLKRTVPDMLYMCENENRLWGCDKRTIYCSKLGDIFNWNVFEGLGTDAYAVDTGSEGSFTGCISYLGVPIFFKENILYKVYGTMPSNYEVTPTNNIPGVMEGCSQSLAVAGETLLYLSTQGVMAYSGGVPITVAQPFGLDRYRDAAAGSTGNKYYISMKGPDGFVLFAYDVYQGMWHTEDEKHMTHFARWNANLYMLQDDGQIWITGNILDPPEDSTPEGPFQWMAEFGDIVEDNTAGASPNKKGYSKLQIRLELDEDAEATVWISYDTAITWQQVSTLKPKVKRSYYLPIIPRRADHIRLKITGQGQCRVYGMAREYYVGSELRSLPGRQ